jgi:hypothetical protein
MDDHSRFLVSYGLHASQAAALVLEVFRAGVASYGPPDEVLKIKLINVIDNWRSNY